MAAGNPRRTNPPYLLPDLDQIPDPLSDLTRQYLPAGETVEGVFVIPPKMQAHGFRWRMDPLQALIFSQKGVLHVFETEKGEKEGSGTWVLADVKSHKVVYQNLNKSLKKLYHLTAEQKQKQDGYNEPKRTNYNTGRTSDDRRAGDSRAK